MTSGHRIGTLALIIAFGIVLASTAFLNGLPAGQLPAKKVITPPRLVSFQINNGAAVATSYSVTLNNKVEGDVTQYRASTKADFSDAEGSWKPYSAAPTFVIPAGFTHYNIYMQVRYYERPLNLRPIEHLSNRISDSIDISLPPQDYTVPAGTARAFAITHGWSFQCQVSNAMTERCYLEVPFGGDLILQALGQPRDMFGAKANFLLFSGRQLNPGWSFKSLYFTKVNCTANNKNHTVREWPRIGSASIRIQIDMWTNAGDTCELLLGDMVLAGPGGKTWEDAFK